MGLQPLDVVFFVRVIHELIFHESRPEVVSAGPNLRERFSLICSGGLFFMHI